MAALLVAVALAGCSRKPLAPAVVTPSAVEFDAAALGDTASGPQLVVTAMSRTFEPSCRIPGPEFFIEVPASTPVTFHWATLGLPSGASVEYRWALDPRGYRHGVDVLDSRHEGGDDRHGEDDDLSRTHHRDRLDHDRRWSDWSQATSVTLGPFRGGEEHTLIVEARDAHSARSRVTVRFRVVAATLDQPLLIVNDTRFLPDFPDPLNPGCVKPPTGPWPTAAELDTFLFARGNVPWRCYPNNAMTVPGLFAGYASFDTIGTRSGNNDLTVRLEVLQRYRHVVWITNRTGAFFGGLGSDPVEPMTALRYMCSAGNANTLEAYIRAGGNVWLLGGGIAASCIQPTRPLSPQLTFTPAPGTMLYDLVHWRSEISVAMVSGIVQRITSSNPGAVDRAVLPPTMRLRSQTHDPFPIPGREGQSSSIYYRSTVDLEFLSQPNVSSEPGGASALDSLYGVLAIALPPAGRITMTYYHGVENPPVVFSGFDIWSFTRSDCQALVDAVLGNIWGLTRNATPVPVARNLRPLR